MPYATAGDDCLSLTLDCCVPLLSIGKARAVSTPPYPVSVRPYKAAVPRLQLYFSSRFVLYILNRAVLHPATCETVLGQGRLGGGAASKPPRCFELWNES